jgi:hypothetical protein
MSYKDVAFRRDLKRKKQDNKPIDYKTEGKSKEGRYPSLHDESCCVYGLQRTKTYVR